MLARGIQEVGTDLQEIWVRLFQDFERLSD